MEVIIRSTYEEASELTARLILDAVRENPAIVLGLATGRTMDLVYQLIVQAHREQQIDFSRVRTFNLDEYIGIDREDPDSYHRFMQDKLFAHINLDPQNCHLPDGMAPDITAECKRYEAQIQASGGIDLQLLGLGRAGHIGFNEPLSALLSRTRAKALNPITIAQNRMLFSDPSRIPKRAITVGIGTILESKRCLMLVTGKEKAEILARAVEGPISSMVSATALQLHPRCTVIVDEEAAAKLTEQEYYRWIFETEPEWEGYR